MNVNNKLIRDISAFDRKQVFADLEAGADVNYRQYRPAFENSVTPIQWCITTIFRHPNDPHDGLRILQMLLDKNPNMNELDEYGCTYLMMVVDEPDASYFAVGLSNLREVLFTMLMTKRDEMDLNHRDVWGLTVLARACMSPCPAIIRRLVEEGADVNMCDDLRNTPLHQICTYYQATPEIDDCIEWLVVNAKADINAQEEGGYTPWMYVAYQTHILHEEGGGDRQRVVQHIEDSLLYRLIRNADIDLELKTERDELVTSFLTPAVKVWLEALMNDFSYVLK